MNAFAQEVTSDAEKTVEKTPKVIGKIEDTSSQEDIKTVTYEITIHEMYQSKISF